MVTHYNINKKSFLKNISERKLYCYGAGNMFLDFLRLYKDINVVAVIDDNVKKIGKQGDVNGVSVISLDDFLEVYDGCQVILITCYDYLEVVKHLNSIAQLNQLDCYVYYDIEAQIDEAGICEPSGNRYQITEFKLQDYTAGQKAPIDVARIAAKLGYYAITLHRGTVKSDGEQTKREWLRICDCIPRDSIVLIQLPMSDQTDGVYRFAKLKKEKNIKIIAVVHDLDILRYDETTDYFKKQYDIINSVADLWIVHNDCMINRMAQRGFDRKKLINLEIFDYLMPMGESVQVQQDEGIIIAGNLDANKSKYIYNLHEIKDVRFNLFGANYTEKNKYDNINYYGAFLPDELIENLHGMFGLVWDGDSIETCSGGTGEYLRINAPHKLSLYLAAGLPIIIWDEAAEADFVRNENLGVVVASLTELPIVLDGISHEEYCAMKQNAMRIGTKLRKGEYMTRAIKKAEEVCTEIRCNS